MFDDGTGVNVNTLNQNAYKVICYNTTFGDQQDNDGHGTLIVSLFHPYSSHLGWNCSWNYQ